MAAGGQAEVIKIQGKYKLLPSVGKLLANGTILRIYNNWQNGLPTSSRYLYLVTVYMYGMVNRV